MTATIELLWLMSMVMTMMYSLNLQHYKVIALILDCVRFPTKTHSIANVTMPTIIPRAKEPVSLVDASKFPKERGDIVEDALDKMISIEKANIASENPPLRGTLVSWCPVGKVRKTSVNSWSF